MEKKQHQSPCAECPFSRKIAPGRLGGSHPLVYVGQINGNFFLPCHVTHDSTDPKDRLDQQNPSCAGAAIFRSNVGVADQIVDKLLHLPADTEKVFASFEEFLAFHAKITSEAAKEILTQLPPDKLTAAQMDLAIRKSRQGTATFDLIEKKPKP